MFGTMTKSFHPGRAAQNGLTAAMLASREFHQFGAAAGSQKRLDERAVDGAGLYGITKMLGQTYEISLNTYKPFACGVVIHPAIDGCIQLRNQYKLTAGSDRAYRSASPSAGAGADRQEDSADGPGR